MISQTAIPRKSFSLSPFFRFLSYQKILDNQLNHEAPLDAVSKDTFNLILDQTWEGIRRISPGAGFWGAG